VDLSFELARGFVPDGRVFAVSVVVAFDVFEHFGSGIAGLLPPPFVSL
jgi:hypothetical protein